MSETSPNKSKKNVSAGVSLLLLGSLLLNRPAAAGALEADMFMPIEPPIGPTHGTAGSEQLSRSDQIAYQLAETASDRVLPLYSPDWYRSLMGDGWLSQADRETLLNTYYQASPDLFTGTATRFGPLSSLMPDFEYYGKVIRQQMERGYVLAGSGNYGYHNELKTVLPAWAPHSVYGKWIDTGNTLLDKQYSPVYIYLAERFLDDNGQPKPVTYRELNGNQKRLYDMSSGTESTAMHYFASIETQRKAGPAASLRSGSYAAAVAGISPNDIGRRFLIFHKDNSNRPQFFGVVLVIECIQRSDWTGIGAASDPHFKDNPMMLRSQTNPDTGREERWAFDLPDELYYAMGGSGGPIYGVTAVDADLFQSMTGSTGRNHGLTEQ